MRRGRSIAEHVTQMSAAAAAVAFRTDLSLRTVRRHDDSAGQRLPETRPSGAAVEFCLRREDGKIAAPTRIRSLAPFFIERTRMRLFGLGLTQDGVSIGAEQRAPFVIRMHNLEAGGPFCAIKDRIQHEYAGAGQN